MLTDTIANIGLDEVLGISDSPQEVKNEIIGKATSIVETRALTEILRQLDEGEQETLAELFEAQNNERTLSFFSEKGIDVATLLEKEALKLKEEYRGKYDEMPARDS